MSIAHLSDLHVRDAADAIWLIVSWIAPSPAPSITSPVEVKMEIEAPGRRRFREAASEAGVLLVLCGRVHRARLSRHNDTAVGLNGQSGAAWAGRTIPWYDIDARGCEMELEQIQQ